MALLRGEDEHLPFLTQFYQVDGNSDAELRELTERFFPTPPDEWFNEDALSDGTAKPSPFLDEVRETLGIVRELMDAIADDGTVDVATINAFAEQLSSARNFRTFMLVEPGDKPYRVLMPTPSEGVIRARSVYLAPHVRHQLCEQALNDLEIMMSAKVPLRRCQECTSVFVVTRPDRRGGQQMYCSHRCSARVGARRRRSSQAKSSCQKEDQHALSP